MSAQQRLLLQASRQQPRLWWQQELQLGWPTSFGLGFEDLWASVGRQLLL